MHVLEYLAQYDAIFSTEWEEPAQSFPIPYIWQCWLQGKEHMPPLVKACMHSVQCHNTEHKIKIIDENSVHQYITIPQHILIKYQQKKICPAHFVDYIRVALLAKYGGTWMDATVFFTQPLPKHIFKQSFFAFALPSWCELTKLPAMEEVFTTHMRSLDARSFSNWFMHAKAHTRYILLIKKFLEEYWLREESAFDYFFFHIFCTYALFKDPQCAESFINMPKISNAHAHLLQQCLTKEYDATLFKNICQLTAVHKLMHSPEGALTPQCFAQFLAQDFVK